MSTIEKTMVKIILGGSFRMPKKEASLISYSYEFKIMVIGDYLSRKSGFWALIL